MIIKKILEGMKYPLPLLEYTAFTAYRRYKVYQIPKRNGHGSRTIAQPTKIVKSIQREIISKILSKLPVHECATAYVKDTNIQKNAEKHKDNRFLLKMDFSNFFNSITQFDLQTYISIKKEYPEIIQLDPEDIKFLYSILFWKPKESKKYILSIGAPSSPILSNILLWDFDEAVNNYCKVKSITYTRYADDLAFSCKEADKLKDVEIFVRSVCSKMESPKLIINEDKTVHTSKKYNRHITGITITNDGNLSLGYKKKIILKSLIHKFLNGKLERKDMDYLKGMLNFACGTDRDFINRMNEKYGIDNIKKILQL